MKPEKLYATSFSSVYPYYIAKAERKGRTKAEVDEIIRWLTGYTQKQFEKHLEKETNFEDFFGKAKLNPKRSLIKGMICGVRIEEIKEKTMREIRYLDKMVDELAKGETMGQILREAEFPKISAPAQRALENAKIKKLKDLAQWSVKELSALHGIGPSSIPILKSALKKKGLCFKA